MPKRSSKKKKEKKPPREPTKYDEWEPARIEAQTAKFRELLGKAAMDRSQVQVDKVRSCRAHLLRKPRP